MEAIEPKISENWSNPSIGLARLYEFLGHCKDFPVNIRVAECVSKIPGDEICRMLKENPYYSVSGEEIYKC